MSKTKRVTIVHKQRLETFKRLIEAKELNYLKDLSDEELFKLLDTTVLPNSYDVKAVKNTIIFHYILSYQRGKLDKLTKDIERIINFTNKLLKRERTILKYGVLKGFNTSNWKREFYLYLSTPLALHAPSEGRKILSWRKFKEFFPFAYKLIKGGENNARLTRF